MGNRNGRTTCLRVEVMEERIALSSLAHAAPGVHAAVVRRPSLIIRLLTPQLTGTNITSAVVDPRTGVVQIHGSIILPPNFAANNPGLGGFPFNITVTQAVGRFHSVTGTTIAIVGLPPSPQTPMSFTVSLTAANGRFGRGYATVTLPDYSTGFDLSAQWLVWLRR